MPIYAYRCAACGHAQDVLQKMSDPVLTVCTACGAAAFDKQLTAAGFQLKGSGWYVTDFRDGKKAKGAAVTPEGEAASEPADKPVEKAAEKAADKAADSTTAKPAESAPAPAPAASSTAAPAAAAPPPAAR